MKVEQQERSEVVTIGANTIVSINVAVLFDFPTPNRSNRSFANVMYTFGLALDPLLFNFRVESD